MATIAAEVPRRPHVALTLRLPPELHTQLARLAEREHRPLTVQIIHVMQRWAEQQEREERERVGRDDAP